jgi:beta-glucosidase
VPQLYTALPVSAVTRPLRELKGFASVELEPQESKTVTVTLRRRDLAYWDTRVDKWVLESGRYTVMAAASSRDIRLEAEVDVTGDPVLLPLTLQSSIGEVLASPIAGPALLDAIQRTWGSSDEEADSDGLKMGASMPVGQVLPFLQGAITAAQLVELFERSNTPA